MFDPVDGTTNYAHGLPIFCSSLALEIDAVAEVAAIYDPTRRELFTAERGGGAFLNGKPLRDLPMKNLICGLYVDAKNQLWMTTGMASGSFDRIVPLLLSNVLRMFVSAMGRRHSRRP